MNFFQAYIHPNQKERFLFLGYWIVSLILWSFMMNISLVIVIVFSFLGYFLVCRPLAAGFYVIKKIIIQNYFNNLDIFEAYYPSFEFGRIVRIALKLIFFVLILVIARIFMLGYLSFIN